jgi:serine/threonine protein kinase
MRARYPYNNHQQNTQVNFEQIPISDRFRLNSTKKLGRGAFGEIFLGMDMKQHEEVAIKLESKSIKSPHLLYEARIYQKLEGGGTRITYI